MALKIPTTVVEYLKARPQQKFRARQIAEWIFATYPVECEAKKVASKRITTDDELVWQIAAEIGAARRTLLKNHPWVKMTEGRPRLYYYSEKTDRAEVVEAEFAEVDAAPLSQIAPAQKLTEHDLYPVLQEFLGGEFAIRSMRIDEKRSSNSRGPNGNQWLHPDLVALEDVGADWSPAVQDCVHHRSDRRARLWSFEVKLLVNGSNVRESFFQAVSNSSWANVGYLVATEIQGASTLKELRMLFAAHGIGLIKLDSSEPAESQILIPAREREQIDWALANRLAAENADFLTFLRNVKRFHQTGELNPASWKAPVEQEGAATGSAKRKKKRAASIVIDAAPPCFHHRPSCSTSRASNAEPRLPTLQSSLTPTTASPAPPRSSPPRR